MPFGGRVYSLGKLLLLAGALVGTFFLFAGVAMRVALRAREVEVPTLTGRTLAEATTALAAVGLTVKVDEVRRPDAQVPEGRVLQQDPAAGVNARRQRSIRVWLSAGPRATTVPALVGQSERTARIRLQQEGIEVRSVTELRSADYPSDVIVAQDPPPSTNAARMALLVNRGDRAVEYVMPDLTGLDGRRAADALRDAGFRVTVTPVGAGSPAGSVVRHQPAAGFQIGPGQAVTLEVSR